MQFIDQIFRLTYSHLCCNNNILFEGVEYVYPVSIMRGDTPSYTWDKYFLELNKKQLAHCFDMIIMDVVIRKALTMMVYTIHNVEALVFLHTNASTLKIITSGTFQKFAEFT
jgi:hypothetical protein